MNSQTFIYDYITELERQGGDNHVATFHRENEEARPFSKVKIVEEPGRWNPRRLWHRARAFVQGESAQHSHWLQSRERLEGIIQEVRPDVIHAHFGPEGVFAAPVARRLGIPLIVTFYGYDVSSLPHDEFWRAKYDDLWEQVSGVTVLSEEMKTAVEELGSPASKTRVVHLSRDLDDFRYSPPGQEIETVVFVGRLVPKKAPIDAIRALSLANERGADLSLDMVGDGGLETEVEEYVHQNDLSGCITLHGRVASDEVGNIMQEADAFLLPSKTAPNGDREGTPTVLIEAQASGLPCVSTRHSGIPEMIPPTNRDLLSAEGDLEGLAESLTQLASMTREEVEARAESSRRWVKEEFNLRREAEKLREVYDGCNQGDGSRAR
ncbi:glycosyltransferase [Salinibacter ruber]|uniref:glycosyltransferase n=1 Tax=Salinibacter ruber TaxID=146919 RepID=UPI00216A6418|nr:glycosyltransferase [Salinibacter ruber]MCS4119434.1 glycosyltransferase involved in cell wall biosynthesis [Salinibacter ruber]